MNICSAMTTCILLLAAFFSNCSHEPVSPAVPGSNKIEMKFWTLGGFAGSRDLFSIRDDNTVSYDLQGLFNVNRILPQSEIDGIIELVMKSGFFYLKDEYTYDKYVADGLTFDISCRIGSFEHRVVFRDAAGPDKARHMLVAMQQRYSKDLIDTIDSGRIIYRNKIELIDWPFSDNVPLHANLGNRVEVSEDIYNYFDSFDYPDRENLFLENGSLYALSRRYEYSTNGYSVNIKEIIQHKVWSADSGFRLSDVSSNGLFISGESFTNVRGILYPYSYEWFTDDEALSVGGHIYQLKLLMGNGFENYIPEN